MADGRRARLAVPYTRALTVRPRLTALIVVSIVAVVAVAAVAGAGAGAASPRRWHPPRHLTWYWQLQGSIRTSPAAHAYDIDGFDTGRNVVARLHAAGRRVVCYIDVGTWENWRPDRNAFPRRILGRPNGWPGERWLDIRALGALKPIMRARIRMCKRKGFDAVEPDNIDGWENGTGFAISAHQQARYDIWIARTAHSVGLAVFQKNDPEQAATLEPYFDGELDEQCRQYDECSSLRPYLAVGKPVLDAEYSPGLYPAFCTADNRAGIMGALFSTSLDGTVYRPCWGRPTG
ncbi:MAG: endo alpha-1,4 polygalactosaminidase [Solirubrobacteraceae bacterium]